MDFWLVLGIVSFFVILIIGNLVIARLLRKEDKTNQGHRVSRDVKFNCSGNRYCCIDDSKLVAMYTFQKLTDPEEAKDIKSELNARGLVEKSDPDSPVVQFVREDVDRDDG